MKLRKIQALALAMVMTIGAFAMPAYADSKTATTAIKAEVDAKYVITVPESVTLTNSSGGTGTYTGSISVNIKGDIGTKQTVTLTATAPTMTEKVSKATAAGVFATNPAPKTKWTRADLIANSNAGTTTTYTVSASLTPGSWTGTATFVCTLS